MPDISTFGSMIYGCYGANCESRFPHLYGSYSRNKVELKLIVLQTYPTKYERNHINISEHLTD